MYIYVYICIHVYFPAGQARSASQSASIRAHVAAPQRRCARDSGANTYLYLYIGTSEFILIFIFVHIHKHRQDKQRECANLQEALHTLQRRSADQQATTAPKGATAVPQDALHVQQLAARVAELERSVQSTEMQRSQVCCLLQCQVVCHGVLPYVAAVRGAMGCSDLGSVAGWCGALQCVERVAEQKSCSTFRPVCPSPLSCRAVCVGSACFFCVAVLQGGEDA